MLKEFPAPFLFIFLTILRGPAPGWFDILWQNFIWQKIYICNLEIFLPLDMDFIFHFDTCRPRNQRKVKWQKKMHIWALSIWFSQIWRKNCKWWSDFALRKIWLYFLLYFFAKNIYLVKNTSSEIISSELIHTTTTTKSRAKFLSPEPNGQDSNIILFSNLQKDIFLPFQVLTW